ncbi:hypothetical protein Xoosp2_74 [Xanthomonas phage Xoo-sp2]|uniref:Uncharacterized protein n=1 Tax=Xanthomonas phage Xoo-sp2 TaxID=1852622 RepID=A0A1X9IAS7_9CAUD|nr:hypothetical protein JTY55_gp74 [Xanthomonas phage Xoo-sp2]ANT45296.1 hypothetical protein Xoosp2_74 [Xanthomonas phage Xoo-sp2]
MKVKHWFAWAALMLLTGGAKSPLRVMEEGRPYRIVRHGRRITIERIEEVKPIEAARRFEVGQRVVSGSSSGFHRGAHGEVKFQEPNFEGRVWVLRDGASSPCFYYPHELELESEVGA